MTDFWARSFFLFLQGVVLWAGYMWLTSICPGSRPGYSCGCVAFFLLSRGGLTIVCVVSFTWPPAVHPSYKTMLKAHSVEYKYQSRNQTVWEEMQTHVSSWRCRGKVGLQETLHEQFYSRPQTL